MSEATPEGPRAIVSRLAASGGFAASFGPGALQTLAARGRLVKAPIGAVLLAPGVMPPQVFLVVEGRVRVLGSGVEGGRPFVVETLGVGGVAGAASLAAKAPVEAATTAEESILLAVPAEVFLGVSGVATLVESRVHPAELFDLVAGEFRRLALDSSGLASAFREALPHAVAGTAEEVRDREDGMVWMVAAGASRGGRCGKDGGVGRCIGFPAAILGGRGGDPGAEVPVDEPCGGLPAPETLLDPLRGYPCETASGGLRDEVVACFSNLATFHGKRFPRDAVRRVLDTEMKDGRRPTISTCGIIAAPAGFSAQLVRVPVANLSRLETPALVAREGTFHIIYETSSHKVVLCDPRTGLSTITAGAFASSFEGDPEVLLLRPLPGVEEGRFGLRWFLPAIRRHKRVLVEVFIASFFIQLFALANPLLVQVIIDKVLVQNSISTLNVLGVLFVLVAVAGAALTAVRTYLFVDTTNRIDLSLGSRIMDHLYRLRLDYFQRRPVGEVSSRLNELENIRQFLTGTALTVGLDAVFSVVYIAVMLFYSVPLTLVALVVVPFLIGTTIAGAPVLRRQIRRRTVEQARSQAHLIETITGVQTVKAGNIEQVSRWEWQRRYAGYVGAGFRAVLTSTAMNSTTTLLGRLGDLAVLWYGAVLVIRGDLTLGQLIAFRIIAGYVTTPLMRLAQSWQGFQEVALSVERLGDVLDSPPEQAPEEASAIPMPPVEGAVAFDRVTFSYVAGSQPVLRDISFQVRPGWLVGVVGRSGSGKSTILKLLPRLMEPGGGRILVDGYEIAKVELYSLRRQIGTVLQDSLLFNASIFENISVGHPDAAPDDVMRAARVAEAHDFIMSLPQGYNTPAGEQGRALSGGQRQRIAIARAVLGSPRLLILDEATSALDLPTEQRVCANLVREFRGRTIFLVTHRVRSIERADHIVVLDKGAVVEQGTHHDLMAIDGHYRSLRETSEGGL